MSSRTSNITQGKWFTSHVHMQGELFLAKWKVPIVRPLYLLEYYHWIFNIVQITQTKSKLKFQVCCSRLPSTSSPFEWIFCPQWMSQCIQFSMWYKVDLFKNHTIQNIFIWKIVKFHIISHKVYYVLTQLIVWSKTDAIQVTS